MLSKRDKEVIWHPYTQMQTAANAIGIIKGEGVYLFDEDGRSYIDAVSSWWVNIHGHAHPYIAQKVSEQLYQLEHCIFAGFTHEPAIKLAERLLKIIPGRHSKVFYSDNGSTAVEAGIKMAVQFWHNQQKQKNKIIVLEHSYHGDTFGAMSVSARSAFTKPFTSLLFDVVTLPFPGKKNPEVTTTALNSVIENNKDEIAAFIFEPLVLGAGGMLMYDAAVLDELIKICRQNNILTIADEVMTGFGRTGKTFACEYLQQEADILCLSKGITGGTMSMGVTTCKEEIFNAFLSEDKMKTLFHGHSYTANPIACTAANASLDLLLHDDCTINIERIAEQHILFAKRLEEKLAFKNTRYCGTIFALDFPTPGQTSYFNNLRDELYHSFLNKGIILRPLGNTIYVLPPYCIKNEELKTIYDAIEDKLLRFTDGAI